MVQVAGGDHEDRPRESAMKVPEKLVPCYDTPEFAEYLKSLRYDLSGWEKKTFRQELARGTMLVDGLWTNVHLPFMRMVEHNGKDILLFPAEISVKYVREFSRTVDNECWVSGGRKYWKGHTLRGYKSPKGFQWSVEGFFSFNVHRGGTSGGAGGRPRFPSLLKSLGESGRVIYWEFIDRVEDRNTEGAVRIFETE
jgi:hypothetical protein